MTVSTGVGRGVGGGRPTKYSKELCKRLPGLFDGGQSVAEVCVELDISKDTFYKWVKRYPRFADAYQKGLQRSEAWWSRLGRVGSAGEVKIQPATWIFNMKNRFGWKDRVEQEHSGEVKGGLVIPMVMDEAEWDAAARKQQALMKGNTPVESDGE